MLDSEILEAFMASFFGYGNFDAPFWFIGMEEGGGATMAEIQKRLTAWHARGRLPIEDVAEFHRAAGMPHLFEPGAPIQTTWRGLIRTIFAIHGWVPTVDAIRTYQVERFARGSDEVACFELLPLPSPSTSEWRYSLWTNLPHLNTRQEYQSHVMPHRIRCLQCLIDEYEPEAVLMYGTSYRRYWRELSGIEFAPRNYAPHVSGGTTFFLLPHPAFRFAPVKEIFTEAGAALRAQRGRQSS